jgi:hypothetical protein
MRADILILESVVQIAKFSSPEFSDLDEGTSARLYILKKATCKCQITCTFEDSAVWGSADGISHTWESVQQRIN